MKVLYLIHFKVNALHKQVSCQCCHFILYSQHINMEVFHWTDIEKHGSWAWERDVVSPGVCISTDEMRHRMQWSTFKPLQLNCTLAYDDTSGMLRRVIWYKVTDVSKVLTDGVSRNFWDVTVSIRLRRHVTEGSLLYTRRSDNLKPHNKTRHVPCLPPAKVIHSKRDVHFAAAMHVVRLLEFSVVSTKQILFSFSATYCFSRAVQDLTSVMGVC